jgi:ribosomal subunit interface protein
MQVPVQITFRHMEPSESVEARIRQRAEELEQFSNHIVGCRVVVESAHHHHRKGQLYHVRVELTVPGDEIVVKRDPSEHHAHEDIYVAIRDAFDAARRQLEDYRRKLRGDTKTHAVAEHGKVARLFPADDYGFILTADGQEIYMHRNSVTGGAFDKLRVGDEVRFALHEGEGEKGAQASTVVPIGKHHLSPSPL